MTWHYRRADPEYGAFQARECQKQLERTVAKKHDVEVMTGKANLEVRPRFVNKGEIAKRLVQEYGEGPGKAPEFVLCMGDDFTDEGEVFASKSPVHSLIICRHVPLAATVQATYRPCLLGHCWRQFEANIGKLASSRTIGRHLCDFVAQWFS